MCHWHVCFVLVVICVFSARLVLLSLRASVATRGNPVDNVCPLTADTYFQKPNIGCSAKSNQSGFIDSISIIFCSRLPAFSFFSRLSASFTYL